MDDHDDVVIAPPPETDAQPRTKTIWREPTPDDPRRRVYRKSEEMRTTMNYYRLTTEEKNAFHRYAQSMKTTMSYLTRAAVEQVYPEIFANPNRNIRKPRKKPYKPRPIPEKRTTRTSFVDGSKKIELP